ncbi:MAG: recombinase family protein, partial [Clostridiales bacterium]|nr:recombinase family protein [Clostridiales bacterium]
MKRKRGEFVGSFSPYGYLKSEGNKNKLTIDENVSDVIKDIFKWKIEGVSQQGIANKLNSFGILSPMEYKQSIGLNFKCSFKTNSKAKWGAVAISRILKNEVYLGTTSQGKFMTPNYKVKKRIEKPKEEWARVENTHEAIISKEIFDVANELLLKDTRIAPKKEKVYIFSGMLICADCRGSIIRKTVKRKEKKHIYYVCSTHKNKKKCSTHTIKHEELQVAVLGTIKSHIRTAISLSKLLEVINDLPIKKREIAKIMKQINNVETELARVNRFKVSIYEDYFDGLLKKSDYVDMKSIYAKKEEDIKSVIKNLRAEYKNFEKNVSPESEWICRFKKRRNVETLTRELLVSLVEDIYVYENKKIEIKFKYESIFEKVKNYIAAAMNGATNGAINGATKREISTSEDLTSTDLT